MRESKLRTEEERGRAGVAAIGSERLGKGEVDGGGGEIEIEIEGESARERLNERKQE